MKVTEEFSWLINLLFLEKLSSSPLVTLGWTLINGTYLLINRVKYHCTLSVPFSECCQCGRGQPGQ